MKKLKLFTLIILFFTTSLSIAAPIGNLVYAPVNPPISVPTLSTTMTLLMSLLLIMVGMRVAKKKNIKAGKFFIALVGVSALMAGIVGGNFVSKVNAGGSLTLLSNPAGGTVDILGGVENYYQNTSGLIQKIISIDLPDDCGLLSGNSSAQAVVNPDPMCTVGLEVALNGICEVDCTIYSVSE